MNSWKRLAVFGFSAGAGFALCAALVLLLVTWNRSQPKVPRPWKTDAVTAEFRAGAAKFDTTGMYGWNMELIYELQNRTQSSYGLREAAADAIMARAREHSSLVPQRTDWKPGSSFWVRITPSALVAPAHETVVFEMSVRLWKDGTQSDALAEFLDNFSHLEFHDEKWRYKIKFPLPSGKQLGIKKEDQLSQPSTDSSPGQPPSKRERTTSKRKIPAVTAKFVDVREEHSSSGRSRLTLAFSATNNRSNLYKLEHRVTIQKRLLSGDLQSAAEFSLGSTTLIPARESARVEFTVWTGADLKELQNITGLVVFDHRLQIEFPLPDFSQQRWEQELGREQRRQRQRRELDRVLERSRKDLKDLEKLFVPNSP